MLCIRSRILVATLALAASACASLGGVPLDETIPPDKAALRVDNDGFADATIYAMDGAVPYRLGFVSGRTSKLLLVPAMLLQAGSQLQLIARPVARSMYRLPIVQVGVRQTVVLTLTDNPAYASAAVIPPAKPK